MISSVERHRRWQTLVPALLALILFASFVPAARSDEVIPVESVGLLEVLEFSNGWKVAGTCTGWVAASYLVPAEYRSGEGSLPYWNHLVVTAGHCTRGSERWRFKGMTGYKVRAFSSDFDIAVIEFSSARPMPTLPFSRVDSTREGSSVMLVSYGRRTLMARVGEVMGRDDRDFILVYSVASPGSSGAPVIDLETGVVVGILVETFIERPKGASPIYCAVASCTPIAPYIASPSSHLTGLIMWDDVRRREGD